MFAGALEVKENTDRVALLQKESEYAMSIYVRHSYMFPYKSLRLLILAQYIDSNQNTYQVLEKNVFWVPIDISHGVFF